MTRVKICGITRLDDALAAAGAGADMLGLNFYAPSPRYLERDAARELAAALRAALGERAPLLVGVFVNAAPAVIHDTMSTVGLNAAQLSGDEPVQSLAALMGKAFKAIRPRDMEEAITLAERVKVHTPVSLRLPSLLLDAYHPELYGGTGDVASVEVARAVNARVPRLMLAGGLTPENVAGRVAAIQPWGVDVASGVEVDGQPGVKDRLRMRAFVAAVRQAARETTC